MEKNKQKIVKLKWGKKYGDSLFIDYKPLHKDYGRAEFQFCFIFKYGKFKRIFIYRKQQETNESYEIEAHGQEQFQITSWTHKTGKPYIWNEFWCKKHETICHEVYVPDNTDRIEFESLSNFEIRFVKKEIKSK